MVSAVVEPDLVRRDSACDWCCAKGDIVLLAGKGHAGEDADFRGSHRAVRRRRTRLKRRCDNEVWRRCNEVDVSQVADWIHAEGNFRTHSEALGFSIDSRTIAAGEHFSCSARREAGTATTTLRALANGAVAAVVRMRWLVPPGLQACQLLRLTDHDGCGVLDSLQQLARAVRRSWGKRVVGITGSAGKTTTKEAVAQVLGAKFRVLKSQGNLNNGF